MMMPLSPLPRSNGGDHQRQRFIWFAILLSILFWSSASASASAVMAEKKDSTIKNNDTTITTTTTTTTTACAATKLDNASSSTSSSSWLSFPVQSLAAASAFETMFHHYYYSPQLLLLYNNYNDNNDDDDDDIDVLRHRVAAAMNPLGDSCVWLPQLPPPPPPYDDDDDDDDNKQQDNDDDDDNDLYRLESYYETAGDDLPGELQILEPGYENQILQRLQAQRDYYNNVVLSDERYKKVMEQCYNDNDYCAYWAVLGMCESYKDYMVWHCPIVCEACHELHVELKCPVDPNAKPAFRPHKGDLNRMFERIEYDAAFDIYEPLVLSRPSYAPGDNKNSANYVIGPWIVVLENFLSNDEADHLVQLGHDLGYERSTDTGDLDETGEAKKVTTEDRTSTNTFCQDDCRKDPIVVNVMERIAFLTGIPARYSEDIQLLRYEEGQFYKVHHDYIEFEVDRMEGPRILTIFMYLNDVEQGGETRFDEMNNLTIQPKRGRVVIWPSVFDKNPSLPDYRTTHEAMPVIKGIKYGANAWIHLRDFMLPQEMGCW